MLLLDHNEEEPEPTFSVKLYSSEHFFIGNTNTFVLPGQLIIKPLKEYLLKADIWANLK